MGKGRPKDEREHGAFRGGVLGSVQSPGFREQGEPLKCPQQENDMFRSAFTNFTRVHIRRWQ